MAETTQEATRSSKCVEKLFLSVLVGLAFFSFAASATGFAIIFVFLCPDCRSPTGSSIVNVFWGVTISLLLLGVITLVLLVYYKRRQHSTTSSTQVAISLIPAEDLEKSPAPSLPYSHVPHRQAFSQTSSTHPTLLDLPDYFTVVENIDEVYPAVNAEVWTEDVPETPPPCYEQTIEMTALALLTATSEQYAFTQETLDKSDELFV